MKFLLRLLLVGLLLPGCRTTLESLPPEAQPHARPIEEVPALSVYKTTNVSRMGAAEAGGAETRARFTVFAGGTEVARVLCRSRLHRPAGALEYLLGCELEPAQGGEVRHLALSIPGTGSFRWGSRSYRFVVERIQRQDRPPRAWTMCLSSAPSPLVTTLWRDHELPSSFLVGPLDAMDAEAAAIFARVIEAQLDVPGFGVGGMELAAYHWPPCGDAPRVVVETASTSSSAAVIARTATAASSEASPALVWLSEAPPFAFDLVPPLLGPQSGGKRHDFFVVWGMQFGVSGLGSASLLTVQTPSFGAPPALMELSVGLDYRDLVSASFEIRMRGADLGDGPIDLPGLGSGQLRSAFGVSLGGALRLTLVRALGLELYAGASVATALREAKLHGDDFRPEACRSSKDCTPAAGLGVAVSYSGPSAGPLLGVRWGLDLGTGQGIDLVLEGRSTTSWFGGPSVENLDGDPARVAAAQEAWTRAWRPDASSTLLSVALGFQARF